MIRTFELTEEEYRTVMSALKYAEENAVHEDGRVAFRQTRKHLVEEYELQQERPIFEDE